LSVLLQSRREKKGWGDSEWNSYCCEEVSEQYTEISNHNKWFVRIISFVEKNVKDWSSVNASDKTLSLFLIICVPSTRH
jgi:hypothetical protein